MSPPESIKRRITMPAAGSLDGSVSADSFVYYKLYCGRHTYQGPPGPQDYYATAGTLTVQGEETNWLGDTVTAVLHVAP